MYRNAIRGGAAVATAVLLTAGAAACSAEDTAKTAAEAIALIADKADKSGSAEIVATTEMPALPQPVRMEGIYTWGDGLAMRVEMDADSVGMGELVSDGTVETRFVDGAYYYSVDPQASGPLKDKHWMRIDAEAILGQAGANQLSSSNQDPIAGVKALKYADDVSKVGEEKINGKTATHYRGVYTKDDIEKKADDLSEKDRDSMLESLNQAKIDEITVDVWVADDLPVRIKQDMGQMTVTMDFKSFGKARTIEAPPASDTADMTDAVKAQQS
ncbi:hypothetical protein AB0M28_08285 [Streptomyces sp. NPDC051940]|uniref:hypothetical protein n=1 Tax=Streptomyces sp. NPDC051940 TaxID=3155675 RepID=UPI0034393739